MLVEAVFEELPGLLDELKERLPYSVAVMNMIRLILLGRIKAFKVLIPQEDTRGTLVVLWPDSQQKERDQFPVSIFATPEASHQLEDYLLHSTLVDWSRNVSFFDLLPWVLPPTIRVAQKKGKVEELNSYCRWILKDLSPIDLEIELPVEVYLAPLELHHVTEIYKTWGFHWAYSYENMMEQVECLPSSGIFLRQTNELVSWQTTCINGYNGCGYTLSEHRMKGYSRLALTFLTKECLCLGMVPCTTIRRCNPASENLYATNGFQPVYDIFVFHLVCNDHMRKE
ncbi:uncharacterized protein LOC111089604 [Limulus polyphemus]|uniref:Uncharacterized protein LOC111089604 n=1 Tax=Limulus polyphemus TaxID=6850 RepID=A0ABM1TQH5_LIMPO|nr:uncharacterized protein LOC111089604 [Limulus polyphemus]